MPEKTAQNSKSMREIFAPVREQIKESGVSDGELTRLLEDARDEVFQKIEVKLTKTAQGVIRIADTRVSIDSVIIAFKNGAEPEVIQRSYDSLNLAQVYSVISYYLNNKDELDKYLVERKDQYEQIRETNDARFGHKGLREKLLARRLDAA